MNLLMSFVSQPMLRVLPGVVVCLFIASVHAEDKKPVTEPLGTLSDPLAITLDFATFNPVDGEKTDQHLGEVISLYDEFLALQGISPKGSPEDFEKLHALILRDYHLAKGREEYLDGQYDALKDSLEKLSDDLEDKKESADLDAYLHLKAKSDAIKKKRNVLRSYVDFEEPALEKLATAASLPENSLLREEAFNVAARSLYSLLADQYLSDIGNDPKDLCAREIGQIANHFLGRATLNATPYYTTHTKNCPVGKLRALKEATNLYDPSDRDSFVPASRLAKLSHEEVSRLDVSPDNPMWHTHRKMESGTVDTWSEIENWVEGKTTEELLDSKKFRKEFPDFRYNLQTSKRVLFWDDIKITATSPKIDTVDALGQKWKLKWAEEVPIEPVANRLRLLLGAKFADLTYTEVGGSSHLLILPSALEKSMNPDKIMPLTREEFIKAMMESKYEFNAKPFILSSGVITESNADTILAGLPEEALKPFRKKRLIGRVWIRFRESMVEAKHDVFPSGGPISTSSDITAGDRALRQSMIVAFWFGHTDFKEDNCRGVWIKGFGGKGGSQYLEYFHDPGSSFGGSRGSGEINKLAYQAENGGFLWLLPGNQSITSSYFSLYRPGHFERVTFADQLSGARHITRLTKADIEQAVDASLMPDFYKACLAFRLTKRRDLIADVYDIPLRDAKAGEAPEFKIPLTTRADRSAAASRYHIPLEEIENDLVRTGHLASGDRSGATTAPFVDVIVKKGVIQPYSDCVIPGILRDFRHPAGFLDRMSRFDDNLEWESRRFGMK